MIRLATRVLVVDDLPDAADSMAALLHLCGFDCDAQLSGAAALDSVHHHRPDIVLLDLRMPRMDGFEFVRRLREVEGCENMPIVIVSGYNLAESRVQARELGIDHFFTKPVELKRILNAMDAVLECVGDTRFSPNRIGAETLLAQSPLGDTRRIIQKAARP